MNGHGGLMQMALTAAMAATVMGCGSADSAQAPGSALADVGRGPAALEAQNGLARNGLARNGLARNGLARNGLARNGLLGAEFQVWFDQDPATSASVMSYVVRCAAPAGQVYSFTSATTGVAYEWYGSLGLAPGWASGLEATEAEEQVVTACLAAHVNKYGWHFDFSILGKGATGAPIPVEDDELSEFATKEACFFGNLFRDQGVYVGLDHRPWSSSYSSPRACAFDGTPNAPSPECPPMNVVGRCSAACAADATGTSYESCVAWSVTADAWVSFRPMTTRIPTSDVYRCGDGVCQATEQCGTGRTADSCLADCGVCPGTTTGTSGNTWMAPTSRKMQ